MQGDTWGPCFGFCLFFQEPVTTHLFLTALEGTNLSNVGPPLCPPPPPSVQTVSQNALDLVLQGTVERGLKAIFLVEILSLYGLLEFLRLCHSICVLNTSCVNMGCLQSLYESITSQCKVCTLHLPASRREETNPLCPGLWSVWKSEPLGEVGSQGWSSKRLPVGFQLRVDWKWQLHSVLNRKYGFSPERPNAKCVLPTNCLSFCSF